MFLNHINSFILVAAGAPTIIILPTIGFFYFAASSMALLNQACWKKSTIDFLLVSQEGCF